MGKQRLLDEAASFIEPPPISVLQIDIRYADRCRYEIGITDDEKEFRDDEEGNRTQSHFEPVLSQDKAEGSGKARPQALVQETVETDPTSSSTDPHRSSGRPLREEAPARWPRWYGGAPICSWTSGSHATGSGPAGARWVQGPAPELPLKPG